MPIQRPALMLGTQPGSPGQGLLLSVVVNPAKMIVFLDETSPTQFLLGSYYIELIITARNSDTQVRFETMSISASGNDVIFSEGVGLYNAGTPTSIELIGGNGDLTGRNYVYKANTAL